MSLLIKTPPSRRVQGLASWYDAAIAADWKSLGAVWQDLAYDTAFLRAERARRRSGSQAQSYDAAVVTGVLRIADVPPDL